jgi:hypothetical protein
MKNQEDPNPLRDRIDALPREIPPGRDLWPEIQARVDAEVEPALRAGLTRAERGFHHRLRLPLAIAAAFALAATAYKFKPWQSGASWVVFPIEGSPQLNRSAFADRAWLREGGWLETDGNSRAKLDVGTIGEVSLEPNSRLRLVKASATDHRLELARGKISAFIWAPPRLFFVQTPFATAIDLGCAYTLEVDDRGAGTLEVTSGYVALEHAGLESIIPAGLMCLTRPGIGPGTPFPVNASPEMRAALDRFDTGDDSAAIQVAELAGENDKVTLWHLLARVPDAARGRIFDTLARLHPPPSGVTRSGILERDADMRDLWGGEIGLAVGR